jgi:hypothetical protein
MNKRTIRNHSHEVAPGVMCIDLEDGHFALVDLAHYSKIAQHRWHAQRAGRTHYARATIDGKKVQMHRLILGISPDLLVDHKDGNGLNNSSLFGEFNLRPATSRLNGQNRHDPKLSRFPGVTQDKRDGKWVAYIQIKGKRKSLGYHRNEEDAARAYENACKELD